MAPVESLFEASSILALALLTPDVSSDRGFRLGRAMLVTLVTLHSLLGNRDAIRDFTQRYSSSYLALQLKTSERTTAALRGFGAAHHRQAASMQPYVAFTWTQLSHGLSLTPPLDTFSSALQRYKRSINVLLRSGRLVINGRTCNKWDVAAFPLCASIVHMNNNRLGVTIPEESFIAFALRRALDDLAD